MNKRIKTSLFAFGTGGRAGGRASKISDFSLIKTGSNGRPRPSAFGKKIVPSKGRGVGGRKPPRKRNGSYKLTEIPRKFNIDFEMMHRIVVNLNKRRELKKGGKTAERVPVDKTGGLTHGDEMTLETAASKTATPNVIGQGVIVKNKNEMTTGSPTSKGIKLLQKINSSVTRMMWNTKLYSDEQNTQISRNQLIQNHGFNTKCWWVMPGCASPGYLDIFDAILNTNLVSQQIAKNTVALYVDGRTISIGEERKYASIMNFKVDMSFTNESNYLPVKLKLMYIMPKNSINIQTNSDTNEQRSGYMFDFQNFVLNSDTGVGNQRDNAIPVRYQLGKGKVEGQVETTSTDSGGQKLSIGDNYRGSSYNVQVATKANLKMSPYFRDNFTIAKTFSRTLDPNDVWNFTHTHNFGSGIELEQMRSAFLDMNQNSSRDAASYLRLGNDRPLVGFWVVESVGVPCTCLIGDKNPDVANPVFTNPYAGTSNGSYHCEIRSSLQFVAPLQNAGTAAQTSTGGAVEGVHMRLFKKRDFVLQDARMVRHVLPENMVIDKDDVVLDKGMITVYTDSTAQAAGIKEYKS